MDYLYQELRGYVINTNIQLNLVASNPRQGGTMFLLLLGEAVPTHNNVTTLLLNEPGNLGVLPGCQFDDPVNPRSTEDMDRLMLIACKLARSRISLYSEETAHIPNMRRMQGIYHSLSIRFRETRLPDVAGNYCSKKDRSLLSEVEEFEISLQQTFRATEFNLRDFVRRHPLRIIFKEHNYNRNEAEFIKLAELIEISGGRIFFTTRRPIECYTSFYLRRTVHFLSAEGNITNHEICEFVQRLLLPDKLHDDIDKIQYLEHCVSKGFSNSGDRISPERLLQFIEKPSNTSISLREIEAVSSKLCRHCNSIIRISYINTAHYYSLAKKLLPGATVLVDFDDLLASPVEYLEILAGRITWLQSFRIDKWEPDLRNNLINFPEMFVLPGSQIEKNVWFKNTLSASGIFKKSTSASTLLQLTPQQETLIQQLTQLINDVKNKTQ